MASTKPPKEEIDIGITIDFKAGVSDPVRVFQAMTLMLDSFSRMDEILISAIDEHAEPRFVLEEIEAASITSWVKTKLAAVEDDALKSLDWKKQVGAYLVKGKYLALDYLEKRKQAEDAASLDKLANQLRQLGFNVPLHSTLFPENINPIELVGPLNQIQTAKQILGQNESITVKSKEETLELDLDANSLIGNSEMIEISKVTEGTMSMMLVVKKPDYLGNSMWEFRHGANAIWAHVLDVQWVADFRTGKVILQPGSALHCDVKYKFQYAEDGKLVDSKHDIVRVREVKPPPSSDIKQLL